MKPPPLDYATPEKPSRPKFARPVSILMVLGILAVLMWLGDWIKF